METHDMRSAYGVGFAQEGCIALYYDLPVYRNTYQLIVGDSAPFLAHRLSVEGTRY
jgi:hypothetical protein